MVHGVTGECPEKILNSSNTDILLVFAPEADVNRVKVQLECQSSWMGKPIHLKCTRPSGTELKQFGVLGTIVSPARIKGCHLKKEGDISLELPFFSGKTTPEHDEVTFSQWLSAVEGAQQSCFLAAIHSWIFRSVREPAAEVVRNLGVGAPLDKILYSLKNVYGIVSSFNELMRQFLNVFQQPCESVTDYVVKLEKAFAIIRDNYPKELAMVDQGQHLRERFYQGLRKEIHQKLTPSYEDRRIPYVVLIKRARQLEAEFYPKEEIAAMRCHKR